MDHRVEVPNTDRIYSGEPFLAVITDHVLPGDTGKGKMVFAEREHSDGSTLPYSDGDLQTTSTGSTDVHEFDIFDVAEQNCLLIDETYYVFFDNDFNGFVPLGSHGLRRRCEIEQTNGINGGSTGEVILMRGESDVTKKGSSDPLIVNAKAIALALEEDKYWMHYQVGDQSSGGQVRRPGQWVIEYDGRVYMVKPNADISEGNSGLVTVWKGGTPSATTLTFTMHAKWGMAAGEKVSSAKKTFAKYDDLAAIYRWFGGECE